MKQNGKILWHRIRTMNDPFHTKVAEERAFKVTASGVVYGLTAWKRSPNTYMEWKSYPIKIDLGTREALEANYRARGFKPGPAPRHFLAPSIKAVAHQDWEGTWEATDGCRLYEPDAKCSHGSESWARAYGMV